MFLAELCLYIDHLPTHNYTFLQCANRSCFLVSVPLHFLSCSMGAWKPVIYCSLETGFRPILLKGHNSSKSKQSQVHNLSTICQTNSIIFVYPEVWTFFNDGLKNVESLFDHLLWSIFQSIATQWIALYFEDHCTLDIYRQNLITF